MTLKKRISRGIFETMNKKREIKFKIYKMSKYPQPKQTLGKDRVRLEKYYVGCIIDTLAEQKINFLIF
jgi:hypothetical protein